MSHEIELDRFYSLGEAAWHRLGTVVTEALDVDAVFRIAGLDGTYTLEEIQATVLGPNGVTVLPVEDRRAIVRTLHGEATVLGVASPSYKIHTPREVWQGLSTLLDAGCDIQTAGSLFGGRKVFITVKMPQGILVNGTDRSDLYLFGRTSFDATLSTGYDLTAVRVVCANTWQAATSSSQGSVKIRHRSAMDSFTALEAREALRLSFEAADAFQAEAERLYATPLDEGHVKDLLEYLFPLSKKVTNARPENLSVGEKRGVTRQLTRRAEVASLWQGSDTLVGMPSNGWRFFNAVTEWADWRSPVKANGGDARDRRAERVILGETADIKVKALQALMA